MANNKRKRKSEVPEEGADLAKQAEQLDFLVAAANAAIEAQMPLIEQVANAAAEAAQATGEVVDNMLKSWPLKNVQNMQELIEAISSIDNVRKMRRNKGSADAFFEKWSKRAGENAAFNILSEMTLGECSTLLPFVNVILTRKEKELPEGSSLEAELEIVITPPGDITKNPCAEIVEEARREAAKFREGSIITKPVKEIIYPIGKAGQAWWKAAELASKDSGQYQYVDVSINSKTRKVYKMCVDFSGLESDGVPKDSKLTQYDKRVLIAMHALFYAGNEYMTLPMIYERMGNSGRPNTTQLQKIRQSILKMQCKIYFSNEEEVAIYKKYKKVIYKDRLLNVAFIEGISVINNMPCDTVIRMRAPSFIFEFDGASDRGHITTLKPNVLNIGGQQTENTLSVEDFLIISIAQMKKGNREKKVLFDTLYRECGITRRQYKPRALVTALDALENYKREGYIIGYEDLSQRKDEKKEQAFYINVQVKKKKKK